MGQVMLDRIDVATLQAMRESDSLARVIDVRTGGEFETAHIPGSYNVPLDTLVEHLDEFSKVSHPVVLVCQSGGRAGQAHSRLVSAGKSSLHVLEGGVNAWIASGAELARSDRSRWALDRQVRLMAGVVAVGGVAASVVVPWTKWFAGAVGVGLLYMAVTDSCPVSPLMAQLPYNRTDPCDVEGVLAGIR